MANGDVALEREGKYEEGIQVLGSQEEDWEQLAEEREKEDVLRPRLLQPKGDMQEEEDGVAERKSCQINARGLAHFGLNPNNESENVSGESEGVPHRRYKSVRVEDNWLMHFHNFVDAQVLDTK